MSQRLVLLVPGFFGFTSIGAISYFEDVEHALSRALRRRRVEAGIALSNELRTTHELIAHILGVRREGRKPIACSHTHGFSRRTAPAAVQQVSRGRICPFGSAPYRAQRRRSP